MALSDGIELPDDFESFLIVGPIHRAHVDDVIKIHSGIIVKELGNLV
jgi:hypothetical protein